MYGLKHTAACHAYLAGVHIKTIQKMMGHKSVRQTETYLINVDMIRSTGEDLLLFPNFRELVKAIDR